MLRSRHSPVEREREREREREQLSHSSIIIQKHTTTVTVYLPIELNKQLSSNVRLAYINAMKRYYHLLLAESVH